MLGSTFAVPLNQENEKISEETNIREGKAVKFEVPHQRLDITKNLPEVANNRFDWRDAAGNYR